MLWVACVLIILSLVSIGIYSVYGVSSNASTFLKGSTPYSVPYEDWITRWWQWDIQIPKEQHPVVNASLTKCPVGESESVSFLSQKLQGKSQYSCAIPVGHAILLPISTGECTSDEAESSVPENMIKCATEGDKYLTFDATVDGVRLNGLDQNYAISKIFNMTVPKDNFLDLKPGQWKTASGGYFIFLKPLPEGDHKISINARVTNPIDPSYNFNYDTLYLLKVQ
jgi:hypothetical protein